ncbi:MAG TPA: hypothetical protein VKB78_05720, partial [Pirellulales bacterium]|nr:hypothetical protein [Pirellulales bacterium]
TGPNTGTVGQQVTFELVVINHGDAPAESLVLKDTFDDGLVNAKAASPIQVGLDAIPPNQGKRIAIKFTIAKAGHLCHTVELTGPGGIRQSTQACLDATNAGPPPKPALSLKITGPATAHVGDRVQFTIEAKNTGDVKIANLKIANDYDSKLLDAKMASPTPEKTDSGVSWTVTNLDPGQIVQKRVDFLCLAEGRVCAKASATDGAELMLGDQACLDISAVEPPPVAGGKLTIAAAARSNPIKVGAGTSFVITVSNKGSNPESKVALVVKIPEQMQYVEGQQQNPTKASVVDGQTIRFDPIAQLGPGENLQFEVRVKATRAGDATLHAEVTSPTTMQPVATDAKVAIFAE